MAIIFVSPKRRQRIAMLSAMGVLALAMAGVAVFAFYPELKALIYPVQTPEVAVMPEIKINFSIVDSDRVKNLDPFVLDAGEVPSGRENPFAAFPKATNNVKK